MGIVKYNRTVKSVAMSKSPYQSGLSLTHNKYNNTVDIEAINPKMDDITSYLKMQIPVEHIDNVINALKELKVEISKNA